MVVRESLLICTKVAGKSNSFDYTIQILEDYICFVIDDHAKQAEIEGRLRLDQLSQIELLPQELREPRSLMQYFQSEKDQAKNDIIEVTADHRSIAINLKSIRGGYFRFPIPTIKRHSQTLQLSEYALKRTIEGAIESKIASMREQFIGREKHLRSDIENRASQNIIRGQTFSLCSMRIIIFLISVIVILLISNGQSGSVEKPIQGITASYLQQLQRVKEWMQIESNLILELKEELNQERFASQQRQVLLESLEQQISELKEYLSLDLPSNKNQRK